MEKPTLYDRTLGQLRTSPGAIDTLQHVLNCYSTPNLPKPDLGELFLSDENEYLRLMLGAVEYAISPHAAKPRLASLVGITSRESAWTWVATQVRTYVNKDDWARVRDLTRIAQAFSRVFLTTVRRGFPIFFAQEKAESRFDIWRIIHETRMERNSWTCSGPDFESASPSAQTFRQIAERNQTRMHERYLRVLNMGSGSSDMQDVPNTQANPDIGIDEEWPINDPQEHLGLPSDVPLSLSGSIPQDPFIFGERSRDSMGASSVKASPVNEQEYKTDQFAFHPGDVSSIPEEITTNEFRLPVGDWEGRLMDVTVQDLQNAIDFPLAGWPDYLDLYGRDQPDFVTSPNSTVALLPEDSSGAVFYCHQDGDLLSIALMEKGAQKAPNSERATMNENGALVPSMEGRPFVIYRLQPRNSMGHPSGDGPCALRLGPKASGIMMQYIDNPTAGAPGVRKNAAREVLQSLGNSEKMDCPATVSADVCLGFSTYACQSAEVLSNSVKVRNEILVRLVGQQCKGRSGRQSVTQRATAGYCPCCTAPRHVAAPLSYELGGNDPRKQESVDLWAQYGPWAQRRHAVIKYTLESNNRGPAPVGWDWAANSSTFAFPPSLIRGVPYGVPIPITTIAESRRRQRQRLLEARARQQQGCPPAIWEKVPEITVSSKTQKGPYVHPKAPAHCVDTTNPAPVVELEPEDAVMHEVDPLKTSYKNYALTQKTANAEATSTQDPSSNSTALGGKGESKDSETHPSISPRPPDRGGKRDQKDSSQNLKPAWITSPQAADQPPKEPGQVGNSKNPRFPEGKGASRKNMKDSLNLASQQAKNFQLSKGTANPASNGNRKEPVLPSTSSPNATQPSPSESSCLSDAIPEPTYDPASASNENWRGLRRPRTANSPKFPKWGDMKNGAVGMIGTIVWGAFVFYLSKLVQRAGLLL